MPTTNANIAAHYLIADANVDSNTVFDVTNQLYWLWLDEQEQTEHEPYTLTFRGNNTAIWYVEEHRAVFEARYFIVQGDDSARTLAQVRERFRLLDAATLANICHNAADPLERGSAIYQLGVAATGQPFDQTIATLFEQGLADHAPGVRLATIWACAWPQWPELRPLLTQVLGDPDEAVRAAATQALLDDNAEQNTFPVVLPDWYTELQQNAELRDRGVIFLDLAAQHEREGGYLPCIAFSDTEIASDNLYTLRLLFRPSALERLYIAFLENSEWLVPLAPNPAAILAFIDKYVTPTEDIPQQQWGAGLLAEVVRLRDEHTRPLRLAAADARYLRYYIGMVDEEQGEELFVEMENSLTFNHFLARRKVCMSAYDQSSATYETQVFSQYSGSLFSYQMQMAYGQAIFFLAINYQPYNNAEQLRVWRAEHGGLLEQLPDDLPLDLAGAIASTNLTRLVDQKGMAELARTGDFNALLMLNLLTPLEAFDSIFLPLLPNLDADCRTALSEIAAARAPESAVLAALQAEE